MGNIGQEWATIENKGQTIHKSQQSTVLHASMMQFFFENQIISSTSLSPWLKEAPNHDYNVYYYHPEN